MLSAEMPTLHLPLSIEEMSLIEEIYQSMNNHITTTGGYDLENNRNIRFVYIVLSRLYDRNFKELTVNQLEFVRKILSQLDD